VKSCAEAGRVPSCPRGQLPRPHRGSVPHADMSEVRSPPSRYEPGPAIDTANEHITVEGRVVLESDPERGRSRRPMFPLASEQRAHARSADGKHLDQAGGVNVMRLQAKNPQPRAGARAGVPDGQRMGGSGGLPKDNNGYDMKQGVIGAEGHASASSRRRCVRCIPKP